MRSIVEAADNWRGQPEAWVVYRDSKPYEVVSVHATEEAARTAARSGSGLSYFGPVTPPPGPISVTQVIKKPGCGRRVPERPVSTVVLQYSDGTEERFKVTLKGQAPNSATDIEALFLTASAIDQFLIPYLARVFGPAYAADKRAELIQE
jgi:hypothetical protein